jgi:hypothetical protein
MPTDLASSPRTMGRERQRRTTASAPSVGRATRPGQRAAPRELLTWIRVQSDNARRHFDALRTFTRADFGSGPEAPTEGHLQATNELLGVLRLDLERRVTELDRAARGAVNVPSSARLQEVVRRKEAAHTAVRRAEQIWDFYFELFGQRQSRFGEWLLACDRIALDCYQYAYLGVGSARSIPAPNAFCYMRTGFSPATFRRGIPLRRLGRRLNPFPLIQLPYHRLVNPWTLGAILHEVAHNLHNDLGLARAVPAEIGRRLRADGMPPRVVETWVRWNRETFADMAGVLYGGPAVVASLMDVIGRSPRSVTAFAPRRPHPTPYLRTFISTELLRRLGFRSDARLFDDMWRRIYPTVPGGSIPEDVLRTFPAAHRTVVDAICFTKYPSLGRRSLAEVLRFEDKEQQMIEEAARRLAQGNDPGVVPERFLIGAARFALDRRLAPPDVITSNFYRDLARR